MASVLGLKKSRLLDLLTEFANEMESCLGRSHIVKHSITTTGMPIRQPLRRMSVVLWDIVNDEVFKDVSARNCTAKFQSQVVMVRKKDGIWRFCIDYQKLNAVTHQDVYPLPRVDENLQLLAGSTYFTTLDLASGYWQVKLDENSKEKTAFSTTRGHYEFNMMHFGLTKALATFQ